jgi:hypothetical protein
MNEDAKQRALAVLDERGKEAIKRLAEPLAELSRAAHERAEIDHSDQDEDYPEFDRVHWLGIVANALPQLCGPHLRVIAELIDALPIEDEEQGAAMH